MSAKKVTEQSAHTPGPWVLSYESAKELKVHAADCFDGPGWVICTFPRKGGKGCQAESDAANARLIAAAPEMLEEIWNDFIELGKRGANSDINHPLRKDWERKRALIAKATKGGA